MSPASASSVYDHLMINVHQRPKLDVRHLSNNLPLTQSKSASDRLQMFAKRKSPNNRNDEQSKRRFTITHCTGPQTIIRYSVNNQAYDRPPSLQKSSTTHNITAWRTNEISSPTIEVKSMDFRPLITLGRRKFRPNLPTTPMIIIKKKTPQSISTTTTKISQKPLTRSIPVDILSNNVSMTISSTIPSSLSYSCSSSYSSSSSTSASSGNPRAVFLPIEITKSQTNNNNNIRINNNQNHPRNNIIPAINNHRKDFHYIEKQIPIFVQKRKISPQTIENHSDDDDNHDFDDDQSTRIPSSSTIDGEGSQYDSTDMMDSQVLRLIRRYDPVGANPTATIKPRNSLDQTRGIWHSVDSNSQLPIPLNSSPLFGRRALATTYEDETPIKPTSTPRLQRQQAIPEQEGPLATPTPPLRPILKYASPRSRAEFNLHPHQTEPLSINIEPPVPTAPLTSLIVPNDASMPYQPLITTGNKRVCAALSKSEWDLRLQQDSPPLVPPLPFPVRPPSPPLDMIHSLQDKQPSALPVNLRQSSATINNVTNEEDDDFDPKSAPIISTGSCVEKLKQLLVRKSSFDTIHSVNDEFNLDRRSNGTTTKSVSLAPPPPSMIEPPVRTVFHNHFNPRTTTIQDVTSVPSVSPLTNKKPILRSQKTIDNPESVSRSNINPVMPSTDLSYDAYRFHRSIDQDSMNTRPRNVAKVEPYSINTNTVRSAYPSQANPIPMTSHNMTPAGPSKARISLNSMGTPSNSSSVASLSGMIRHSNDFQSDFLVPHSAFSSNHCSQPAPLSHSPSNSSSPYSTPPTLLSDSFAHGSLHHLSAGDPSLYNDHHHLTSLSSSAKTPQLKHRSLAQTDFHPHLPLSPPSLYPTHHPSYGPPASYHYRPAGNNVTFASPMPSHNHRQIEEIVSRPAPIERAEEFLDNGQQQNSRRRFHKRKQMKRSKSVDLCQDPSSYNNSFHQPDPTRISRQQRSISREYLGSGAEGNLSPLPSSSSSSSSMADIERVNQAALLRYKSLDSMTFNHRSSHLNGKDNHRRAISKPTEFDFDSDDSVCGIPKARKTMGR